MPPFQFSFLHVRGRGWVGKSNIRPLSSHRLSRKVLRSTIESNARGSSSLVSGKIDRIEEREQLERRPNSSFFLVVVVEIMSLVHDRLGVR